MRMTIIDVLKARSSRIEARLAIKYPPIRVKMPKELTAAQVAEVHDQMFRIQKIARGK